MSAGRVELFCLFIACSYTSIVVLVGYGTACAKFSEIRNCQNLCKVLSDFVEFLDAVFWILFNIH